MFRFLLVVLFVAFPFIFANEEFSSHPGKLFFWSYGDSGLNSADVTKSMNIDQAISSLKEIVNHYELVVVLHPKNEADVAFLSKEAGSNGKQLHALHYVYSSNEQRQIRQALQSTQGQTITLARFPELLQQQTHLLKNHSPEFLHVQNQNELGDESYDDSIRRVLSDSQKHKILFVSYSDTKPTDGTISTRRKLDGHYSRILASDNTEGIYYEPEGTEFSIYKANTYLYLTPDIFTGILTGLFVFFTVLLGMSCLGQIQGMSSFYDKIPVVGREA